MAPGLTGAAAMLGAAAGAIHLAMAPIHAGEARREAVAFAVVGVVQLLLAGAVLRTRRSTTLVASVAVGVVAAGAWAWSRRWALPFDLGGPEDPGLVDGLTAGYELAAVAVAAVALAPPARRWRTALTPAHLLPLHLLVAVSTAALLAAPSTAEHGGHAHGDEVVAAGVGAGGGAGASGSDHGHGAGASDAGASAGSDAGACPEAGTDDPVTEPPLQFPGPRLDPGRAAALDVLAADSEPLPCGTIAAGHDHTTDGGIVLDDDDDDSDDDSSDSGDDAGRALLDPGGHGDVTPEVSPLDPTDAGRFDEQWATAAAATTALATPELAAAAGYVRSSPQTPGVGTHWIDWTLVDAPFDPARPSMLLFDQRPGRPAQLVGFSYWTRSTPGPPDGFAGPNDVWHRHVGLCFVDGWLFQEDVPSADHCGGDWLNGTDLWMLHAWVRPDLPNPDGPFAGRHRAICPSDAERLADVLTCNPITN